MQFRSSATVVVGLIQVSVRQKGQGYMYRSDWIVQQNEKDGG